MSVDVGSRGSSASSDDAPGRRPQNALSAGARGFRAFAASLRADWWLIAVSALVCGCVALGLSLASTPEYRSSAVLYVTAGADDGTQSAYQGSLASQQRVSSYASLAKSEVVVSRSLERSGLGLSVAEAKAAISAKAEPDTVLLTVSVVLPNADDAAALTKALSEVLVTYVSELERPTRGGEALAKLTIVAPAMVDESAVSPLTARNTVGGFAVGIVVGLIILYIRFRIDGRFRSVDEIEEYTGLPVLSAVPLDDALSQSFPASFELGGPNSVESYRKLRSSLGFSRVDNPAKVVVVTSAMAGEGKSMTAVNLAAVLAETDSKVLIIDGDLRRSTIAKRLSVPMSIGFTDVLAGRVSADDVTFTREGLRFDVLVAGTVPPNPAELLLSNKVGELLEELRERYDYVIIDSAPLLPVADTTGLARWADAAMMVVRFGQTKAQDSVTAVESLQQTQVDLLGVVVNGVRGGSSSYYYYGDHAQTQ